jgi:hypothetical protein
MGFFVNESKKKNFYGWEIRTVEILKAGLIP